MDRPILVTGASGFIGSRLVSTLLAEGTRVRTVVRSATPDTRSSGAETIVGDLRDERVLRRAADGVGMVYHLAGRLYAPHVDAASYVQLHVDATRNLADACAEHRCDAFVLCSTTGVFGGATGEPPPGEDAAPHPSNPYESSKLAAEEAVAVIARRTGMPVAIARPGLVYGPGDRHLLPWFRAIARGLYRVVGSGRNFLHPTYIDDLVAGLRLCAASARSDARVYHLVGPRRVSMRELSDAIGRATGHAVSRVHLPVFVAYAIGAVCELLPFTPGTAPLTRSRVRFMTGTRAYDGTRARTELGFTPNVDLDAGLARTVAWYRSEGLL